MTELELSNEFLTLVESMEMPAYMLDAVLEAFGQSHEVDRTPMSKEEIKLRLDAMEQGNRMMGMPFDRKAVEADMVAKPWKYKAKPLPKKNRPTADQFMQSANTLLPTQEDARDKYYRAVLATIFQTLSKYNIPCSTGAMVGFVKSVDRKTHMPEFSVAGLRAANALRPFPNLQAAVNDPVVKALSQKNVALTKLIDQTADFLIGLGKAQESGELAADIYLKKVRQKYQARKDNAEARHAARVAERDNVLRHPSAMEDDAAKKAKEAQLAKQAAERFDKEQPGGAKYDSMADAIKDNPNMEYKDVVDLAHRRGMSDDMLSNSPQQGESLLHYMGRVQPDKDETMMEFCGRMNQVIGAAYPKNEIEDAYSQLKFSKNPDDQKVFDQAEESFGKVMLAPKDKKLYVLWKSAKLKQAA